MSADFPAPRGPNPLGTASLLLGILASTCVFSVGLCAGVGKQQGWLPAVGTVLFLLGGTFAFVGLLAAALGVAGLVGRRRSRAAAVVGVVLGVGTLLLFAAALNAVK